jgi:hypothetical protein
MGDKHKSTSNQGALIKMGDKHKSTSNQGALITMGERDDKSLS